MSNKEAQTITKGGKSELFEIDIDSSILLTPQSCSLDIPEPTFDEIQHLVSDKPIRFNRCQL